MVLLTKSLVIVVLWGKLFWFIKGKPLDTLKMQFYGAKETLTFCWKKQLLFYLKQCSSIYPLLRLLHRSNFLKEMAFSQIEF
jgi:hypothetical protein